jgi:hypothetical protein
VKGNEQNAESQNWWGERPREPFFIDVTTARQEPHSTGKSFAPLKQVTLKRNQPGKFISRVNVFLDDIESEIIKPAKAPNGQRQQDGGLPFRIVQKYENGRDNSDEQE